MKYGYSFLLAALIFTCTLSAREINGREAERKIQGAEKLIIGTISEVPEYIRFKQEFSLPVEEFNEWAHGAFTLSGKFGFKLLTKEDDGLGMTHYRYQETFNGFPMAGTMYIVHTKNNNIVSMNGLIFNKLELAEAVSLDEKSALSKGLNFMNAAMYRWQMPEMEKLLKIQSEDAGATYYPKGELMYVTTNGDLSTKAFRLAWRFDIYAEEPLKREYVFVDAASGEILFTESRIHHADSKGTALTAYSGTRQFTTDSVSPISFRLREKARGLGIETYNMKKGTSQGNSVDFLDSNNIWNNVNANLDQYATDAHWGAEVTYDFYKNKFNRNSINNAGFKLINYVHYSSGYVNAFWDGNVMTFGDGNSTYKPLTSIDIEAHEITHGLTDFTSSLGGGEAGALNEGFSDCMGYAIRYYGKQPGSIDWVMGNEIGGAAFRNSANPSATSNPDTYQGTYWDFGQEVHQNSTVLSHWYYLLTTGGSGTNDKGWAYTVNGVGLDTATAICYRMNTVYLFPSAKYADARTYAIQAAIDLYGGCTNAVKQTQNAWYAVGIGSQYTAGVTSDFAALDSVYCSAPANVVFDNNSSNSSVFTWNFGDNTTSTAANPTHTYTSTGLYTVSLIANGGSCGIDTLIKTQYINISNANPCIISLPALGVGAVQTACSGKLYDSGGASSNYQDLTDVSITIAPTGASKVSLIFTSFSYETNYDYLYVYNGPSTASPLIGKYTGTGLPNGGTVSSTGNSITIRQVSDQYQNNSGFALTWQCTLSNVPPTAYFTAASTSSCSGTIQFNDSSLNGPTGWRWEFGDGTVDSASQNPIHTYLNSGIYTVKLTAKNSIGVDSVIKTNLITINLPNAPVSSGLNSCAGNTVTLNAIGSSVLTWYNTPSGGNALDTGVTFTTPPLSKSATYYVESKIFPNPIHGGAITNNFGTGSIYNGSTYRNLIFDCFTAATIVSVKVYAQGTFNRTIILKKNGNTIMQKTVSIPDGTSRVTLNFPITPGTGYELGMQGNTYLYRNDAGASFPYTIPGVLSITGNNANLSGYYYFFYDWEVQTLPCISPRTPVSVNVDTTLAADFTENVLANQVDFTDNSSGNPATYLWDFGDSSSVNNTSSSPNPSHIYSKAGTYEVCLSIADNSGCSNAICKSITINVIAVIDQAINDAQIEVHPNPTANYFVVNFGSAYSNKKCLVKLTDMLGQKVAEKEISAVIPNELYSLNLSAVSTGPYILTLQTDTAKIIKKIIKQ